MPYLKNSYFTFNSKLQLISCQIEEAYHINAFIRKIPSVGDHVVEILAQPFRDRFLAMAPRCLAGTGLHFDFHFKTHAQERGLLQLMFSPLVLPSGERYLQCSIAGRKLVPDQQRLLDQYAHMASHDLRAPVTNILSLSKLMSLPEMDQYDRKSMIGILEDINQQAEKLDQIISTLLKLKQKEKEVYKNTDRYPKKELKHILLLDDDALTNKLHAMIISRYFKDREIVSFESPREALLYLSEHLPELILLDLNMPDINGWSFLQILEENEFAIDVVIVSSTISPAERLKAYSFPQVKDFLTKPLTYDKIKHLLKDDA